MRSTVGKQLYAAVKRLSDLIFRSWSLCRIAYRALVSAVTLVLLPATIGRLFSGAESSIFENDGLQRMESMEMAMRHKLLDGLNGGIDYSQKCPVLYSQYSAKDVHSAALRPNSMTHIRMNIKVRVP